MTDTSNMTDEAADALARQCAQAMWAKDKASQNLGMEMIDVAAGRATFRMKVQPYMLNGHNICHGGYIFTLADTCFAFACNSRNNLMVAQHCTITFIAPILGDMELTARATEIYRHRRNGLYDIVITDEKGTKLAVFRGAARQVKGTHIDLENTQSDDKKEAQKEAQKEIM